MSKQTEKLKKQLLELAEVVNSFQSEAVQLRVIDRVLDYLVDNDRADLETVDTLNKRSRKTFSEEDSQSAAGRKKPGATKILNQVLSTDFFDQPRSISSIAEYCKENYDAEFKTSELSGILLKLANENKLKRERSTENNRFEYVRA
jgi:hypothetical protein